MTEIKSNPKYLDPWHQDVLNLLSSIEENLIEINVPKKWRHKHTVTIYSGDFDGDDQSWELVAVTENGFYWKKRIL